MPDNFTVIKAEIFNPTRLRYVEDDGGRAEAGLYSRHVGDCVTRSIAIATGIPYKEVHEELDSIAKSDWEDYQTDGKVLTLVRGKLKKHKVRLKDEVPSSETGHYNHTYLKYLLSKGWVWTPTMGRGTGCRVHLRRGEIPAKGRYVVRVSKHLTCVVDGVIRDTHRCDRDGNRCVYGWWSKPDSEDMNNG